MELSQSDRHRTSGPAVQTLGFRDAARGARRRLAARRRQLEAAARVAHGATRLRARVQDLHKKQASALNHLQSANASRRPVDSVRQLGVLLFQKISVHFREWFLVQQQGSGAAAPASFQQGLRKTLQQIEQARSLLGQSHRKRIPALPSEILYQRLLTLQRERLRALCQEVEQWSAPVLAPVVPSPLPPDLSRTIRTQTQRPRLSIRQWLMHPLVAIGD